MRINLNKLKYFVGKVCTITTTTINRSWTEDVSRDYFVCIIEEVNEDGIWGRHPHFNTISFYQMDYVISITEEMILDTKNPNHQKVLQDYQKKMGKPPESDLPNKLEQLLPQPPIPTKQNDFVDIEELSRLAKK